MYPLVKTSPVEPKAEPNRSVLSVVLANKNGDEIQQNLICSIGPTEPKREPNRSHLMC